MAGLASGNGYAATVRFSLMSARALVGVGVRIFDDICAARGACRRRIYGASAISSVTVTWLVNSPLPGVTKVTSNSGRSRP